MDFIVVRLQESIDILIQARPRIAVIEKLSSISPTSLPLVNSRIFLCQYIYQSTIACLPTH
jgi:hypothetical protein